MTTTMASHSYKEQLKAAYLTALAFGYFDEDEWWDTHTDADLAMALELAELLEADWPLSTQIIGYDAQAGCSIYTFDWLRTEVRNALLERAS